MLLLASAILVLGACATTSNTPERSSPTDKLRKADNHPELHGDLQITLSRTH